MSEPELSRLELALMRFGTVGELMALIARGGRWWLLLAVVLILIGGGVLMVLQALEVVLPFLYV